MQPHLSVPIGIIGCNWGGTTATAWLDEQLLAQEPLNIYLKEYEDACRLYSEEEMKQLSMKAWEFATSAEHDLEFRPLLYGQDYETQLEYVEAHKNDPLIPMGPYSFNRPDGLYHTMLEPITQFPIKGVIWYQGESDAVHADMYDILMEKLIACWRSKWQDPLLPFLFVQLAPFGVCLECTNDKYALIRKQQEKVAHTVPGTGMISIMDIGSYYDIHPKEKMEVGRRLALLARGQVYGEDILCQSPCLTTAERGFRQITLHFAHGTALHIEAGNTYWRITQDSKPVVLLSVSTCDDTIILETSPLSAAPVTVSLGNEDYAEIHIYNGAGLPVCPFEVTI